MAPPPEANPGQDLHPLLRSTQRTFTIEEVAKILGVSYRWVHSRVEKNEIKHGRLGKLIKIPRSEAERLDSLLRAQFDSSGLGDKQ